MRPLLTVPGLLAATLALATPLSVLGQEQKTDTADGGRIIRRGNQPESPTQGNGSRNIRRRIATRMREGAGLGGGATWVRQFAPAAPYPVTVEESSGTFSVRSDMDGVLRIATSQSMYTESGCEVQWSITPSHSGVDLTYTIHNPTGEPQALPTLQLGGHDLGDVIQFLDHRVGCEWTTLDATGGSVWSATAPYPQSLYSPVIVARNDRVAVGLSLLYPMYQYRHQIRTYMGRSTGRFGSTWNAKFYLDGELAADESRDYVVAIRYTDREDWIHTLEPYKEYFSRHGSVRYQQNLQPVWGMAVSDTLNINGDNRRGFRGTRADLNGWEADVDYILDYAPAAGFQRVMVWGAAGMYDEHRQNNFPPQFMAEWTGPMIETESQWSRIRDAGVDLLFWWGRSGQYADRWNDDELERFSPTLTAQSRMMLDQYRLALRRGASGVGLDAFTQMDGWQAIPWIALLRELKPDATIIAEPAGFDLLHLHVPTMLYSEDLEAGPHLLADYLVPGREIWVYTVGEHQTREKAEEYISQGMTVLLRGRNVSATELQDAIDRAMRQNGQQ